MIVLIMLLIILSISFGIKIKLKISQEESLLVAVFGMVLFAYILGIFNLLWLSIYLIVITSVISFIYVLINLIKKKIKIRELITLPTIIYVLVIIFIYYIVKDLKFIAYDEFMFWGTNLKVMFEKSCLWAHQSIDGIHLVYPPFTSIAEYLFCKINGAYNEGIVYFGMITLIATSLMPLFKEEKYSIKSFLKVVISYVITYIALVLFVYNIANLSVDCFLGILFAVSMVLAYKLKDKKEYITLIVVLISLTLIKTNGILFAGIVIMQLFFKEVFLLIKEREKTLKNILKRLSMVVVLLLIIITTYTTWKIYYTINGKQIDDRHDKNYTQNIDISELMNAISQNEKASDRNKKVASNFLSSLISTKIIRRFDYNTVAWIFLASNILLLINLIIGKNKLQKLANYISINIGFVLYCLTNLVIFMFVFQENQGDTLQGFERYMSTYMLAMVINIVYLILEKAEWKRIVISILIGLFLQHGLNSLMLDPRITAQAYGSISDNTISENANQLKQNIKENDKVYIIDQQIDYGLEFVKTRYYLAPIKTNLLYEWNIGSDSKGIYYKTVISENELMDKLISEEYKYIYLISVDKEFLEDYKNIMSQNAKEKLQNIILEEPYMMKRNSNVIILKINKDSKMIESLEEGAKYEK